MRHIDELRLEKDSAYRFEYLAEFMGFGEKEIAAIHSAAAFLAPKVPALVDVVYDKLQTYDSTWRHFLPRQSGYQGEVPASLDLLSQTHPQIDFRKQHLGRYLAALVTRPYDAKMAQYVDNVGKIHTPKAGSPQLDVPLVQMDALMGFVSDAIMATLMTSDMEREELFFTMRAFNKLLWIQNDFIVRHYSAT